MARINLERLKEIERLVDERIQQFFTTKENNLLNCLVNWYANPQFYTPEVKKLLALEMNISIAEFLVFDLLVIRAWMITTAISIEEDLEKIEEAEGQIEIIVNDTVNFVERLGFPAEETRDWFWNLIEKSINLSEKLQWRRSYNPSNN